MAEGERAPIEHAARTACERADYDRAAHVAIEGYGPEVFGFLLAVHRDETAASDAFAEFAEALWRSLPTFGWGCSLRTWAYAVARNVSRMARRAALRRERRAPRADTAALEDVAQAVRTATLSFLRTEKRTKLEALKDSLSPEDRELLILRVDRQLSWNDVARVLGGQDDEAPAALDETALARDVVRLRKRFQIVKDRLRSLAREQGIVGSEKKA